MSGSQVPRLKDVAEAANVSLSAASRILRGQQDRFGDETCQRVLEAARQLGWRRNLLVNGIQTGRTKMIGVIVPPFDSFWVGVLSGVHMTLAAADYLPITVWVGDAAAFPVLKDEDDDEGLAQISRLLDRRVDGLILWPRFAVAYQDHFRELIARDIPVAVIDHQYSADWTADSIETDEEQGSGEVAEHLLQLGHRRIACLSTRENKWQAWAQRRRARFEDALRRARDVEYQKWHVGGEMQQAIEVAQEMLTSWQPTAVFAITDHEAVAVYHAAHQLQLRIPEDVSVIGFADLDFAGSLSPPLTTVRQHAKEIGRQAARLVVDRLEGVIESGSPNVVRVGTDLVVRGSTGPPQR